MSNWRISFVRNLSATHQSFCFSEHLAMLAIPAVIFISRPDRHTAENKWRSRRREITSAIHHPVCIRREDERSFSCCEILQQQYTYLFLLTLKKPGLQTMEHIWHKLLATIIPDIPFISILVSSQVSFIHVWCPQNHLISIIDFHICVLYISSCIITSVGY